MNLSLKINRSFLSGCAIILLANIPFNLSAGLTTSNSSVETNDADSQAKYGKPRFHVKDAANCYVAADNPGFWNFRGGSKSKELKQELEERSAAIVPIWWYELLSATAGDEGLAKEEAKIAKRFARRRLKRKDGLGSIRALDLLRQCIELICQEYPDGHPKDSGETQLCPH